MFCKEMLSTIIGGGHFWCYVLPTSVCDTKIIICQYSTDTVDLYAKMALKIL